MKKILTILIILAVLAGGFLVARNDLVERRHNQVDIGVDYTDVVALAREAVISEREMLVRLKEMGVTAVGFPEAAVDRYRLEGSLAVVHGGELINTWRTAGIVHPRLLELLERGKISAASVYFVTENKELADRLVHKAQLKLRKPANLLYNDAPYVIEIPEDIRRVMTLRIGWDKRDLAMAEAAGLRVIPRPDNLNMLDVRAVEDTLREIDDMPIASVSAIVFDGNEVTGFPQHIGRTAEIIKDAGVPFGIVEVSPRLAGALKLAALTENQVVLVHSNFPRENVHAIVTSAKERRVRLLYVRVDLKDPDFYRNGTELITGVAEDMTASGYVGGPARAFATPRQEPVWVLLLLAGVAAAVTLLLVEALGKLFCPLWLAFLVILAGLGAAFPLLSADLALQAVSILAAMVFSVLAVLTQQLNRMPEKTLAGKAALLWSLAAVLRTFLFAIAGGLIVLGLTSNHYFTSGVPLFRGVKLVHTLPLMLVALVAVMRVLYGHIKVWTMREMLDVSRRALEKPVLILYVFILGVLAVLGFIYVGRTGHTAGIPVPALEQQLRVLLGEFLLVRPRFKEFLIGYPLSVLGLMLLAKGYRNIITAGLVILGAVATVSVVNTFMHFVTPGYTTLLRSFNGLVLGIIFGLVLTAVYYFGVRLWKRVAGR